MKLTHGDVTIAAITSCTNTSNPSVMVAAGLLAKKAVEHGLRVPPYVKTSLAPGSRVVTDYLNKAGLTQYLDSSGFNTVGYGCTTCIGNSGPAARADRRGHRKARPCCRRRLVRQPQFRRPHQSAREGELSRQPAAGRRLCARRLGRCESDGRAGRTTIDKGTPVFLRDIWPTQAEINDTIARCLSPEMFRNQYANVESGNDEWNKIPVKGGELFTFDEKSTYIQEPPFFTNLTPKAGTIHPIAGAGSWLMVGDSVTTDHISPAGSIKKDSPAGKYLDRAWRHAASTSTATARAAATTAS